MAAIKASTVRVLLLLQDADNIEIAEAACLDPGGFLVERGLTTSILLTALRQTACGQVPMAPQVTSEMLAELQNPNRISVLGLNQLTPREQETLKLLVEGYSNKQIAHRLGIGINGAKRHVANVLAKLNCPNRTLAATEAVRMGVI
jgi:DNA-binding NarL/FixJ family response regulator